MCRRTGKQQGEGQEGCRCAEGQENNKVKDRKGVDVQKGRKTIR
jgi:hypothetical protein